MKNNNYLFATTAIAALMTGAVANAAITVSSQSSATKIAFDDTGTELGGISFSTTATYDGILFENWAGALTTAKFFGASTVSITGTANYNGQTGLGGADQYSQVKYTGDNLGGTVTISGLDSLKTYRIQYGFQDGRNGDYPYSVNTTLTLSDTTFANQTLSFGATGTGDDYELITAQVSGTTSLALLLPQSTGPNVGSIVNAFSVHEVIPEPSAALLGGLGLLALLRRRRA